MFGLDRAQEMRGRRQGEKRGKAGWLSGWFAAGILGPKLELVEILNKEEKKERTGCFAAQQHKWVSCFNIVFQWCLGEKEEGDAKASGCMEREI